MNNYYGQQNYYRHRYRRRSKWPRVLGALAVLLVFVAGVWWGTGLFNEPETTPENPQQVNEVEKADKKPEKAKKVDNGNKEEKVASSGSFGDQDYRIVIHKLSHQLELYKKGEAAPYRVYSCATAKNNGDKTRSGDNTTPTSWGGVTGSIPGALPHTDSAKIPFEVDEILYAGDWSHDFGDGNGEIPGAYGQWFISLNTGWDGIGIHGTHDPSSIGTNASEGCIRLYNDDIIELKRIISQKNGGVGVKVVIQED